MKRAWSPCRRTPRAGGRRVVRLEEGAGPDIRIFFELRPLVLFSRDCDSFSSTPLDRFPGALRQEPLLPSS